jgi:hypothetical protein
MACSLGWNLQPSDGEGNENGDGDGDGDGDGEGEGEEEELAYTRNLWWALVSQDIWF